MLKTMAFKTFQKKKAGMRIFVAREGPMKKREWVYSTEEEDTHKAFVELLERDQHLYEVYQPHTVISPYFDIDIKAKVPDSLIKLQISNIVACFQDVLDVLADGVYSVSKYRVETCHRVYKGSFKTSYHLKLGVACNGEPRFFKYSDFFNVYQYFEWMAGQRYPILFYNGEPITDNLVYHSHMQQMRLVGQSKHGDNKPLLFSKLSTCTEKELVYATQFPGTFKKKQVLLVHSQINRKYRAPEVTDFPKDYPTNEEEQIKRCLQTIVNTDDDRLTTRKYRNLVSILSSFDESYVDLFHEWIIEQQPNRYSTNKLKEQKLHDVHGNFDLWGGCWTYPLKALERMAFNRELESNLLINNVGKHPCDFIAQQYVDPESIFEKDCRCYLLHSPMGSGKSNIIYHLYEKYDGESFLHISPRRSFAQNKAKQYEEYGVASYITKNNTTNQICSLESLAKLKTQSSYKVIIFDEIEAIISQITSETVRNHRTMMETLERFMKSAEVMVAMDGLLSDKALTFFKMFDITPKVIVNTTNTTKRTLKYIPMERVKGKRQYLMNAFVASIEKDLEAGKKVYVTCASKTAAKRIYESLTPQWKGRLYTGEEAETKKDLREDVNEIWNQYDLIVANSAITVGINFDKVYFHKAYVMCTLNENGATHRDMMQSMMRVRHLIDNEVVFTINPFTNHGAQCVDYATLYQQEKKVQQDNVYNLTNGCGEFKEKPIFSLSVHNLYEKNLCKNRQTSLKYLMFLFKTVGCFTFQEITEFGNEMTETVEHSLAKTSYAMYDTIPEIDEHEYERLMDLWKKDECSNEQRDMIEKYRLNQLFEDNEDIATIWNVNYPENRKDVLLEALDILRVLKTPDGITRAIHDSEKRETNFRRCGKLLVFQQIFDSLKEDFTTEDIEKMWDGMRINERDYYTTLFGIRDRTTKNRLDEGLFKHIIKTLDCVIELEKKGTRQMGKERKRVTTYRLSYRHNIYETLKIRKEKPESVLYDKLSLYEKQVYLRMKMKKLI